MIRETTIKYDYPIVAICSYLLMTIWSVLLPSSFISLTVKVATGETYCIAHHVSASEGTRTLFIASLRYYDVFAKVEGKWLFAERKIMVDWTDTRPINVW